MTKKRMTKLLMAMGYDRKQIEQSQEIVSNTYAGKILCTNAEILFVGTVVAVERLSHSRVGTTADCLIDLYRQGKIELNELVRFAIMHRSEKLRGE